MPQSFAAASFGAWSWSCETFGGDPGIGAVGPPVFLFRSLDSPFDYWSNDTPFDYWGEIGVTEFPQVYSKWASETRRLAMSLEGELDDDELLSGTPTVTASPSGTTISGVAINDAQETIGPDTVAIGKAVVLLVAGGTAGTRYTLTLSCGTDLGQTVIKKGYVEVV